MELSSTLELLLSMLCEGTLTLIWPLLSWLSQLGIEIYGLWAPTRGIVGSKRYRSKIRRNPPPPWNYIVKRYDTVQQTRCRRSENTVTKKILDSFSAPKSFFCEKGDFRRVSIDIAFNAIELETNVIFY